MIRLPDQEMLVNRIVCGLLDQETPASTCVLLPPGFADECLLAEAIRSTLSADSKSHRVAVVFADALAGREAYARDLAKQWNLNAGASSQELPSLFAGLSADDPGFQIILRFHYIARKLDEDVLALMRNAEQSRQLRTVTITPLLYPELKRRWEAENIPFCVSDYGDRHRRESPAPLCLNGLLEVVAGQSAPEWLGKLIWQLVGGFPSATARLIKCWVTLGRPPNGTPEVRECLRNEACQALERTARLLDAQNETHFSEAFCHLYRTLDFTDAIYRLERHDWRRSLIEGNQLRVGALGALAEERLSRLTFERPSVHRWNDLWSRSRHLYRNGYFSEIQNLLREFREDHLRPHLRLLLCHARIMSTLYGSRSDAADYSPDWHILEREIATTSRWLQQTTAEIPDAETFLLPRLEKLGKIAKSVASTIKSDSRYVDALSGLRKTAADPRLAALLIALKFKAAENTRSAEIALNQVVVLPEQIFRSWAGVALNLNYYCAPDNSEGVWSCASERWASLETTSSRLEPTPSNKEFFNFKSFAYFSYAWLHVNGSGETPRPEPDWATLQSALSLLQTRNDAAHAVAATTESVRQRYFKLIGRWLDTFCRCCPGSPSRDELLLDIEPLKLVGEDGLLDD